MQTQIAFLEEREQQIRYAVFALYIFLVEDISQ